MAEMIATLAIISIISITAIFYIGNTVSVNKEEAYEIMKNNIISVSYDYIKECDAELLSCNHIWNDNETSFKALELKSSGYLKSLESPIDDSDLSNCLIVKATNKNGVLNVNLIDNCY